MNGMSSKRKNDFVLTKEMVWMLALSFFFAIALNYSWRQSSILWYGSLATLFISYAFAYNGSFRFGKSEFLKWYISFLGLCIVSLLWCLDVDIGMEVIKVLIVFLGAFFLLQFSVNYGFTLDKIIICFFLAMLANMLYLITNIDLAALGETQIGVNLIEGWNGNGIGFMATEGALAGFYLMDKSNSRLKKFVVLAVNIFFCFLTMYTGSRTAFAMLVAGILLYLYIKKPTKVLRNIILTLILLFVVYYLVMNVEEIYNVLGKRIEGLLALVTGEGEADHSATLRDTFIKNGKRWFRENPIIGYGVNNYRVLDEQATGWGYYAHNNYIEIAVDLGVVGLILYYVVYLILALRLLKTAKNNPLHSFLLASLLASLISYIGTVSYYGIYQNLLLFMCFVATNSYKTTKE